MSIKRSILSVHSLNFGYGGKTVLEDIEFSVERGSICGLLGPNASGKTTLLKCMNGILVPQSGDVRVEGQSIRNLSRQEIARFMAVVPQQMRVVFTFTALQMVLMGKAAHLEGFHLPSTQDRNEARKALAELGAGELTNRRFNELSGGERQIVLLARTLFQKTPILLLDEPTSHLDFRNQFMVMDMVRNLTQEKGLTAIVSLPDPNLASRYCSHLIMLKDGRVFREGTRIQVFEREVLEQVYGIPVIVESRAGGSDIVLPRPVEHSTSLPEQKVIGSRHHD
jgi:iron complex transport system ATP-binding protein